MKIQPLKWPVIKQVADVLKGAKTVAKILGFITGQRTQKLVIVFGILLAIVQPLVVHNWPEYNDALTKVMEMCGVAAGWTFAEKIQRLIEAIKDAAAKS